MKNYIASTDGSAAAAILGAGLGTFALGLTTTLAEAIPAVSTALTFSDRVGALSGQTTVAIIIWLICWTALHNMWNNTRVNLGKVFSATLVLILLGLAWTFPLVWDKFH